MIVSSNTQSIPDSTPPVVTLTQTTFPKGVISLINESKLPKDALRDADNIWLQEDGAPQPRPGVDWFGTAPSFDSLQAGDMFVASDDTVHLLVVAGSTLFRSLDDGHTWTACTGANFTPGHKVKMLQANAVMYLFDAYDNIVRYDGTTNLVAYVEISPPTLNTPTKVGLAGTPQTYTLYYQVSAVNEVGYTQASNEVSITTDTPRNQFSATGFVTLTWNAVAGATRYDIYASDITGREVYIDSVDAGITTYQDKLQALAQVQSLAPTGNTTQGPRVGDMALVGDRIMATNDPDYPYRVWITGAGAYLGEFGVFGQSTYVDLQKGSQFKPVHVEDYRDGKQDAMATVWCDSKDGKGCIWQGSLTVDTASGGGLSIEIPIPVFNKLPGSRGTASPESVVNVLNDYMYFNEQAFYDLGSRAQFLNLLSTDEASANIRPDVRRIKPSAAPGIVGHFYLAKVYFSVPYDSDTNNYTIIYDTERKCWLPKAFTIGFDRFFTYTDMQGNFHQLCYKNGDTKLSEISPNFTSDYGLPIQTSLVTGLMSVSPRDRFSFMWCDEAEFELAEANGNITVELSGLTMNNGFTSIASRSVGPTIYQYSYTKAKWTTQVETYVTGTVETYSEPSLKRYFNVQEEINAYQYRITTNQVGATYILRTLQITGTASQTGMPRDWELFD